jgi:tetraprenyl-beta-curcumene synthase
VRVWRSERRSHGRIALAITFIQVAGDYWLSVYPRARREVRNWRARAEQIPEPELRRLALDTLREEQGNLEGAAAFAVLAPRRQRAHVVKAVVAFQTIYDYTDTLAEQPSANASENAARLHGALLGALDPWAPHVDHYASSRLKRDGGYLGDLVYACQAAWGSLPAHGALRSSAVRVTERMVAFQGFNHHGSRDSPNAREGGRRHGGHPGEEAREGEREIRDSGEDRWGALAAWAEVQTPPGSGLRWWETAAAGASSLTVFALIAAAAAPQGSTENCVRTEQAYFPWIGALHVLLDSLVDRQGDVEADRNSLVEHYSSPREIATRLNAIAIEALRLTKELRHGDRHALICAAMVGFYLVQPQASSAQAAPARVVLLATLGERGALVMPVLRLLQGRRERRHGSL